MNNRIGPTVKHVLNDICICCIIFWGLSWPQQLTTLAAITAFIYWRAPWLNIVDLVFTARSVQYSQKFVKKLFITVRPPKNLTCEGFADTVPTTFRVFEFVIVVVVVNEQLISETIFKLKTRDHAFTNLGRHRRRIDRVFYQVKCSSLFQRNFYEILPAHVYLDGSKYTRKWSKSFPTQNHCKIKVQTLLECAALHSIKYSTSCKYCLSNFYIKTSGQSYKQFTLLIYVSRGVIWCIFKSGTTLES